jgi:hypothetical protein
MLAHYAVLSEEALVPMPAHRTRDPEAEVDLIAMIGQMLKSAPLGGFVVAVYQAISDAH